MVIAIGGGIVALFVVFGMLFGGSGGSQDRLNSLVQRQTELIRVATLADKDTTDPTAKNLATTVKLSMTSANNQTSETLKKVDGKLNGKQVGAKKDATVDTKLAAAKQANRFDAVFIETMAEALADYRNELKNILPEADSAAEVILIKTLYQNAGVLLESTQ